CARGRFGATVFHRGLDSW
nr:immunoglobulin heavy chain junction region [Macaca mulatta]MOW99633.1 immunoglobulin heavy chain junction region [Macaca mulatta]MOX00249.1 immunoglobulin heavy chain junction region [Macaca mulatta]MOX02815.1 immunoglobulin heavy chain junction region [Macaca mulatta]MOX02933.1 immunoglobulin heavy chain junction region [Macaca mulatta]